MLKTGKIYFADRLKERNLHRSYWDYITMQILGYAAGQSENRKKIDMFGC